MDLVQAHYSVSCWWMPGCLVAEFRRRPEERELSTASDPGVSDRTNWAMASSLPFDI